MFFTETFLPSLAVKLPSMQRYYEPPSSDNYVCALCGDDIGYDDALCFYCWPECSIGCGQKAATEDGGPCHTCIDNTCSTHNAAYCEECPQDPQGHAQSDDV